jgi:hypothetical protein
LNWFGGQTMTINKALAIIEANLEEADFVGEIVTKQLMMLKIN